MARRIPSYRLHRPSGQAVVTLSGQDCYLGPHGSPESRARYDQLIAEWLAGGSVPLKKAGTGLTVADLAARYLAHFAKRKRSEGHRQRVEVVVGLVVELYGNTPATEFGPIRLKAVRLRMIEKGWTRREINTKVGCIRLAWDWGLEHQLVPETVARALHAVRGLEEGDDGVSEGKVVLPAHQDDLDRFFALPNVPEHTRDAMKLQLLTAARVEELLGLSVGDIQRDGEVEIVPGFKVQLGAAVWAAVPPKHKTQRKGKWRVILFSPAAQEILARRMIGRADVDPLFRRQRAGDRMTARAHYWAIRSRIDRHNLAHPDDPIRRFTPRQLRKTAADNLERQFGEKIASVILGHSGLEITRRFYLTPDLKAAAQAIESQDVEKIG